ncbi:MAG TPA: hypothetical protein VGD69_05850 [Herpetosiphonaceae bacterium]
MTENKQPAHTDAEDGQRREQAIDTAQGPGPVLDQDTPAPMPLFNEHERTARDLHSVIDPAEFAELSQRSGEELDQVRSIGEADEPGVAERAAQSRPLDSDSAPEQ